MFISTQHDRGDVMGDTNKKQRPAEPPKRGEAAWKSQRDAIASRNERASQRARARRQEEYAQLAARELAAERRERAELAKRHPQATRGLAPSQTSTGRD